MSRYSSCCCVAVSLLLALAVTASATATASALPHEEDEGAPRQEGDKREVVKGDAQAQLLEEATRLLLAAAGNTRAAVPRKDEPYTEMKPSGGGGGDDQSSSSGGSSGEHSKEGDGKNIKEGEKRANKNCLTKEACHKKKIICGKECTLSAHSKCAAKCSKSCVPTC